MPQFMGRILRVQPGLIDRFLDKVLHRPGGQTGPVPGDKKGILVTGLVLWLRADGQVSLDGVQTSLVQIELPLFVAFA